MFVCKACGGMLNLESRACPQCGREADDAWFLSARGEKCFEDLNYPGSAHEFANAARLAPGDARIGRGLAHAHFHSGSVAEAESRYRRLLASDPDNPECLFNLGQILTGQGELDEAKTLLERLIRIPCEFTSGEFYLGLLFKEAVHFKADCHFHLAMVYWNRGDPSSSHRH
ncbi:tetratricopeptide repeat protein, partial [Candidatus Sumerlaeota bacterium]|nr:tetratricopeptide repeat protein [Candidatus Sumerlaeota bacterium]